MINDGKGNFSFEDEGIIYVPTLVDPETRMEVMDKVAEKATDGMTFVEVGPLLGGTVCHLGQRLKQLNKRVTIFAIDLWICNDLSSQSVDFIGKPVNYKDEFEKNIIKTGIGDMVISIVGDSIECTKYFHDKSIDFIFLDGCHGYPYTSQEIQAWLPKMKDNSTLTGHDYCGPIAQAVIENFGNNYTLTSNGSTYIIRIGNGLI
jgi:hypothetical protein